MSALKKLLVKFFVNPNSVSYREMEKILTRLDFKKVPTKGSHVKFKHPELKIDIVIPVHNGDCKDFYKQQTLKQIHHLIKNHENKGLNNSQE